MLPYFFGENDHRLFGVYHRAAQTTSKSKAVLICSPIGHEYIKSYRIVRLLADKLSENGHHVFRFDWFGHGDSSGDFTGCLLSHWLKDLQLAIEELSNNSNLDDFSIVGIRIGSAIALKHIDHFPHLKSIILWDPVLNANHWLSTMKELHETVFKNFFGYKNSKAHALYEVFGFHYTPDLQHDLKTLNCSSPPNDILLYLTCSEFEVKNGMIAASFFRNDPDSVKIFQAPDYWGSMKWYDRVIMNSPSISCISNFLKGDNS